MNKLKKPWVSDQKTTEAVLLYPRSPLTRQKHKKLLTYTSFLYSVKIKPTAFAMKSVAKETGSQTKCLSWPKCLAKPSEFAGMLVKLKETHTPAGFLFPLNETPLLATNEQYC